MNKYGVLTNMALLSCIFTSEYSQRYSYVSFDSYLDLIISFHEVIGCDATCADHITFNRLTFIISVRCPGSLIIVNKPQQRLIRSCLPSNTLQHHTLGELITSNFGTIIQHEQRPRLAQNVTQYKGKEIAGFSSVLHKRNNIRRPQWSFDGWEPNKKRMCQ